MTAILGVMNTSKEQIDYGPIIDAVSWMEEWCTKRPTNLVRGKNGLSRIGIAIRGEDGWIQTTQTIDSTETASQFISRQSKTMSPGNACVIAVTRDDRQTPSQVNESAPLHCNDSGCFAVCGSITDLLNDKRAVIDQFYPIEQDMFKPHSEILGYGANLVGGIVSAIEQSSMPYFTSQEVALIIAEEQKHPIFAAGFVTGTVEYMLVARSSAKCNPYLYWSQTSTRISFASLPEMLNLVNPEKEPIQVPANYFIRVHQTGSTSIYPHRQV